MTKKRRRKCNKRDRSSQSEQYCKPCSKITWSSKDEANAAVERAKANPECRKPYLLNAYQCPAGNGWHIGHNYMLAWASLCIGEHR